MTIIKQTGVSSKSHQKNLRAYINDDRKVLMRASQNMEHCTNIKRWVTFMEATRRKYGHDKSSRHIRDKKTGELVEAKNTIMYHQILAFLPDECDINGGKLTPEDCMRYAKDYVATYYPHQEVVMALHNEYCRADKTHRYAVHIVINRSDLETGKRLDEGRGQTAKVKRAKRVRAMDGEWGLKQVELDEANSAVHKKQPTKIERALEERGGESYKYNLRELCRLAAEQAQTIYEYRELLEGWGVDTQFRNGRMYVTDKDNARYSFSVKRLDAALSNEGLEKAFRANIAAAIHEKGKQVIEARQAAQAERERIQGLKDSYLTEIRETYLSYRKKANSMRGTELSKFPKLKLSRPPQEVANDPDVQKTILAYWRGADELRVRLASKVPYARKPKSVAGTSSSDGQRSTERQTGERERGGRQDR